MKININEFVRVKLTPYGHQVYERYLDAHPLGRAKAYDGRDAEGALRLQHWELMQIFGGDELALHKDAPFVDCEIELVPRRAENSKDA